MPIEAAIFPIPEVVALPGTALQLHVFEPRYRQMVIECIERARPLAVALGRAGSGRSKPRQSLEEMLTSNQESYVPAGIFGVGDVGVLARLPDGRFLVEVTVRHRARLVDYVQEVPYLVANVEILPPDPAGDPASLRLFDGLLLASDALLGEKAPVFRNQLGEAVVRGHRLDQLVYPILQWFQVGAAATQALLEESTDYERGARLLAWMIRYLEVSRGEELHEDELEGMLGGDESDIDDDDVGDKGHEGDQSAKVLPFRRRPRNASERPRP